MSTNSAPSLRHFRSRTFTSNRRAPPHRRPMSSLDRFSPRLCRRRAIGSRTFGPRSLQSLRRLRLRRTSGRRIAGIPATIPASVAGASNSARCSRALSLARSRRRLLRLSSHRRRQLPWSRSPWPETSDSQAALSKAFLRCLRL
jgi:hypothetical protein